jgi:hypothetical protein
MIAQLSLFALLAAAQVATAPVPAISGYRGLPPEYDSAIVLLPFDRGYVDSILPVFTGDIAAAFPGVATRRKQGTPREWQDYLASSEAESLRGVLRSRVPDILGRTYLMEFRERFPEYNIPLQSFPLATYWLQWVLNSTNDRRDPSGLPTPTVPEYTEDEIAAISREGRHVIGGIWFDSLPIQTRPTNAGLSLGAVLAIYVPDPDAAVAMGRIRENFEVWMGFRLTGAAESSGFGQYAGGTFPVARDPVVMVVDKVSKEVIWIHEYNGPDVDPAKPKPHPRHRGCW